MSSLSWWVYFEQCEICGQPAGKACLDLRYRDMSHLRITPHPLRKKAEQGENSGTAHP